MPGCWPYRVSAARLIQSQHTVTGFDNKFDLKFEWQLVKLSKHTKNSPPCFPFSSAELHSLKNFLRIHLLVGVE